jgi:hypothetical protein
MSIETDIAIKKAEIASLEMRLVLAQSSLEELLQIQKEENRQIIMAQLAK